MAQLTIEHMERFQTLEQDRDQLLKAMAKIRNEVSPGLPLTAKGTRFIRDVAQAAIDNTQ